MRHLIKSLAACCLLLAAATKVISGTATNELPERIISADLQQTNGPLNTMFKFCVGAGRANEGLRADWQRQLTIAHRECGFEYIRMHGLFTDDMGVYRDYNGKPEYNWQYIDELYDFLHSIGMKPFVELGFMPRRTGQRFQDDFLVEGQRDAAARHEQVGGFYQSLCRT